ncbi:50S ribosomal protein L15 [Candidatus Babeliales bacterium]|nr:50S ribosomal protein L15 [Candidatus Babeliales bacterium]
MSQLNNLQPLCKKRKRIGRGGSRGGTSGKGHKGQKARSGPCLGLTFEGGQMPLARRLPKRGFTNARFKTVCYIVSIQDLEKAFEEGALINKAALMEQGLLKRKKSETGCVVKVLGAGKLTKKLIVEVDRFSEGAKRAIEQAGGEAKVITEG